MNLLKIFFLNLLETIRRNPLTVLIIVLLAVAAPSVFGFILYFILGMVLLLFIAILLFSFRVRALRRQMEEQMRNGGGNATADDPRQYGFWGQPRNAEPREEGDVTLHKTHGASQKKVSREVGEYVDFDEVEEKSKTK